ncbi:hypothetical protein KP509_18G036700 [Ceratopteris richardii]|uniref:Methyltransferase n=1 Tax=Ceratopteris richardii TaxID=49495 RepID=A0A8T2SQU2_CERRI|nr:hypothetical protein KP509_18G036700 [Ceratopteris richardii]KAH7365602.1 hypothetical protein KP509_18G036700 [Ceratopteris richardii]
MMTRLLQRGSSTNRFAEDGWSHNDVPMVLDVHDKESTNEERTSVLLLFFGFLRKSLRGQKFQNKACAMNLTCSSMSDCSLRSSVSGSHSYTDLVAQSPEASSLSLDADSLELSPVHPIQAQSKKVLSSLAKVIMLSFISVFLLVAVLGSNNIASTNFIYSSYRRFHEQFSLDLVTGGIFGLGVIHPKELTICPISTENQVPCYNISTSIQATSNDEVDRYCEPSDRSILCLTKPPQDYSLPFQWPQSKNFVRIQHTISEQKANENKMERITSGGGHLLKFENQRNGGVEMHFQKISTMLGIPHGEFLNNIGVRTVLDIGCSYGAVVAHLISKHTMALCIAPYEIQNSHVQITLERGLPAMIGSLLSKQLPYPPSSFNMIHCADCVVDWNQKDGLPLLEVDRLLKTDGYFVWTRPLASHGDAVEELDFEQILQNINEAAKAMCWVSLPPQDQIFIWKKSPDRMCSSKSKKHWVICDEPRSSGVVLYQSLRPCIDPFKQGGTLLMQQLDSSSLSGFLAEELLDDPATWSSSIKNYWSIITPLIFSDHPKRPAEDDPLPPSNIFRNVMDMNALFGGFNTALLQARKSVWVMNVVPVSGPNTLPIIHERGLLGTLHDWCKPFPTYPRTYDLLHGAGILSQQIDNRCSVSKLLIEMDRILRPEGWVILRDYTEVIEEARLAASQMRWEARAIGVDGHDELQLLVCQKSFWKD